MHDTPTFNGLDEDKGEKSSRCLGRFREFPASQDRGCVFSKGAYVQESKGKVTHLALACVAFLVFFQGFLKSTSNLSSGCEEQRLGAFIPFHESRNVPRVPGLRLFIHEILNGWSGIDRRGGAPETDQAENDE